MRFKSTARSILLRTAVPLTAYLLAWIPILAGAAVSAAFWLYVLVPLFGEPVRLHNMKWVRETIAILLGGSVTLSALRIRRPMKHLLTVKSRYRHVIESASDGIFIVDADGEIETNSTATEMLGYQPIAAGSRWCPETSEVAKDLLWIIQEVVAADGELRECRLHRADGRPVVLEASGKRLEQGGAMAVLRDVTERKLAEEALRESERRYRVLFRQGLVGVFSLSRTGVCLDCNNLFARLLGYPGRRALIGKRLWGRHVSAAERRTIFERLWREGRVANREVRLREGATAWALVSLTPLEAEPGARESVIGTMVDLSPIKTTEARLRLAVREKEVLLKEVHHRVKNNLQIIASLLSLQSSSLKTSLASENCGAADRSLVASLAEGFEDCRERVNAISMVHETLYRSEDVAWINFPQYVQSLIRDLRLSFGRRATNVTLRSRVEIASLGLDAAIPCGLIINELVSNSLKHGFPDGRKGTVDVEMTVEDGAISLTVRDSGVGLPPELNLETTGSLGMRLVSALIRQLGGRMSVRNEGGSQFTVRFSEPEAPERVGKDEVR